MSDHRKEAFLRNYDREHQTTMRVLRAYPAEKSDFRPSEKSKTAKEVAWIFVLERGLGRRVWNNELAKGISGKPPEPPERWEAILEALEKAHLEFRSIVAGAEDSDLDEAVRFLTGPKTMGDVTRHEFIWFLLHDQIHHRGQLSVYLRMVGAPVPSIYGPSGDEPWT